MGRGRKSGSIFVKFSAAFFLVGLIPLLALSFFAVQTFSDYVERYTTRNVQQMIMYMSYNLNAAFNQYNDISKLMYTGRYEGFIESYSQNQSRNVNELEQINTIPIDSFLKTLLFSDPYITSVYFVRETDGKLYVQEKENRSLNGSPPYDGWLETMRGQPNKVAFFPAHSDGYFFGSSRSVFTVARNLIDTSGKLTTDPHVVGTLFLDVDSTLFLQYFRELSLGENDGLYLVDGNGRYYFHPPGQDLPEPVTLLQPNQETLVMSEDIPFIEGRLIARIQRGDLFQQLFTVRNAVYLAILACSVVLVIMGIWFSRRLAAPIRDVIKQMAVVESGNLDTKLEVKSNDEMGRLAHGFNRMAERLQVYINEAYIAQIKHKQSELNALKAQIRPHYLYNTLEVIRMNAVDKEADETADMILALSNQLKYVIDYGEERVSLERELEHLRDYFYILSVRFENRFELKVETGQGVDLNWPVLKLSLQPVVENAVQHGLRAKGRGTVAVAVETAGGVLTVTVYDNGAGMDEKTLGRLNRALDDPSLPGKSVGLKNVHERIRTGFGEPYGLSVSSRQHIGTSVQLQFPVLRDNA